MQFTADKIPSELPLLPLKDIVVFPQMILPVFVAEDICLQAVNAAFATHKYIFLSAFSADESSRSEHKTAHRVSSAPPFDVYDVGTIAAVMRTRKLPDGRTKVLLQGIEKAEIKRLQTTEPYPIVEIAILSSEKENSNSEVSASLIKEVKANLEKYIALGKSIAPDMLMLLEEIYEPGKLADLITSNLSLKISDAQAILGEFNPVERLKEVNTHLIAEMDLQLKSENKPKENSKNKEIKNEKQNPILKEKLRLLRNEFEGDSDCEELDELKEKVLSSGMQAEAMRETLKNLKRLERMNQDSSEANLTRTYVEWMCELPWSNSTESFTDIQTCKKILDEDHYGLEKIKDRILEYLAVAKLNPSIKGPILCFVGPPGVGKTSLGRSVARALNRKFVRISLGGVRDEAEIRGHRRTYVGANPGRIIQAIKNCGVNNPVLMLDELDKLNSDYKGDPSSALLEVLDPEQNSNFSDHYISVPFDLSQVMFIANANRLDTIPAPLRDRLEIIEVSGYSEDEKMEISKRYIIPKTVQQNGLNVDLVQFQDASITTIINHYTRESGLRNLERQIASVVRKLARAVAEGDEKGKERKLIKVTPKLSRELLGEDKYIDEEHNPDIPRIGVATGLAYTSCGGEILQMEVNLLKGKGGLTLTGQLGDVMKESGQTALSYIKTNAQKLGLQSEAITDYDVHLHVPAGAVPKDGPSAGVAITMALLSAFRQQPLRQDVAMTGEITLHGRILPVGGLREKILAALRNGIKTVLIPDKNRGAISEIPINIRRKIEIKLITNLDQVIAETFVHVENERVYGQAM